MYREGFYRRPGAESSELPMPVERAKAWKGEREFLEQLVKKENYHFTLCSMNATTDPCHFCGKKLSRNQYWLGVWKWTAALLHYVKEHHVRPSLGFQEFVVQRELV